MDVPMSSPLGTTRGKTDLRVRRRDDALGGPKILDPDPASVTQDAKEWLAVLSKFAGVERVSAIRALARNTRCSA
jgi:hypothetical protein